MDKCILFCGNASHNLGGLIIRNNPNIQMGVVKHKQFPSGEWYCQFQENIRGADVFLLQATSQPCNDNLMQLLVMIDAARRASAGRITVVIPYFGYSRQERKDAPRVAISAKMVMNILYAAGANRIVTMDLHAPQIQGFTDLPLDQLQFRPSLVMSLMVEPDVIVAPDTGAIKRAEELAKRLKKRIAIVSKERLGEETVEAKYFIGDVRDKSVLIVDDLTESLGTIKEAAHACAEQGASYITAAVSHGCLTNKGYHRLQELTRTGVLKRLFVSNTIEHLDDGLKTLRMDAERADRISTVDVSSTFAEAIWCIHTNQSVTSLFD